MNYDMTIHTNPDARDWAKFFRETNPDCNVSDDIMIGWFSNAMMAMHDHLAKQKDLVGAPEKNFVDPLGAPENKKLE